MAHRKKIAKRVKVAVYERDNWTCQYCELKFDPKQVEQPHLVAPYMYTEEYGLIFLELDHIHPLAHGGSNDAANLQAACSPCNRRKWAHLPSSRWDDRFEAARKFISAVDPSERSAERVIALLLGRPFSMRELKTDANPRVLCQPHNSSRGNGTDH